MIVAPCAARDACSSLARVADLVRGKQTGAGLSGGWRGFAVDQRLCVGDAVTFQQRDRSNPRVLDVHVFRAHLLGGEREALEGAFDLAEALTGIAEGAVDGAAGDSAERAADNAVALPAVSPVTRPALHWHSCRAKAQRRFLPEAVRRMASRRVDCDIHQCETLARHALEGSLAETPDHIATSTRGLTPSVVTPPKSSPAPPTAAVVPPPSVKFAPIAAVEAAAKPAAAQPAVAKPAAAKPAAAKPAAAQPAAAQPAAGAAAPIVSSAGGLPLHASLWGAPLARGAPLQADYSYFLITALPSLLDDNFELLTYAPDGMPCNSHVTAM